MRFSAIALAAAVPAFVSAATVTVNVGQNGTLAFNPSTIVANVGDMVQFVFQSKNHSVIQSTFADPCARINGTGGFSSGFQAVPANSSNFQTVTMNVTQSAPIWLFCAQTTPANHCQMGMVAAVNPTSDKTLDMFQTAAKASSGTAPGVDSGATATTGGNSTSSSGSGSGSGTASSPTPSKSSGAMRISGSAAGLLTLVGVAAGVAL